MRLMPKNRTTQKAINMTHRIENRFLELLAEKRRKDRHPWTYEDISQATGISPGTLVRYAQQRHGMYDRDTLAKLCEFFDCSIGELLVLVEEPDEQGQLTAVQVG
jgi:DNA-binding Xre family transcriptional regulator